MNLFVLDTNPIEAARFHNDRHVLKMILETAQMLSMAHIYLDGEETAMARVPKIVRPSHVNHPCAKWVRESSENYKWASHLLNQLGAEYEIRFGAQHRYARDGGEIKQLRKFPLNMPIGNRTPFPQCMPAQFKRSDPVEAYRMYYFYEKRHLAKWSPPSMQPAWWTKMARIEMGVTGDKYLYKGAAT